MSINLKVDFCKPFNKLLSHAEIIKSTASYYNNLKDYFSSIDDAEYPELNTYVDVIVAMVVARFQKDVAILGNYTNYHENPFLYGTTIILVTEDEFDYLNDFIRDILLELSDISGKCPNELYTTTTAVSTVSYLGYTFKSLKDGTNKLIVLKDDLNSPRVETNILIGNAYTVSPVHSLAYYMKLATSSFNFNDSVMMLYLIYTEVKYTSISLIDLTNILKGDGMLDKMDYTEFTERILDTGSSDIKLSLSEGRDKYYNECIIHTYMQEYYIELPSYKDMFVVASNLYNMLLSLR